MKPLLVESHSDAQINGRKNTAQGRKIIEDGALHRSDLAFSDPFDIRAGQTLALRGSDNQRVHLLTTRAQERYAGLSNLARDNKNQRLDIVFDGDQVWMAGIPAPGDMTRSRQKLIEAGFSAETSETTRVLA